MTSPLEVENVFGVVPGHAEYVDAHTVVRSRSVRKCPPEIEMCTPPRACTQRWHHRCQFPPLPLPYRSGSLSSVIREVDDPPWADGPHPAVVFSPACASVSCVPGTGAAALITPFAAESQSSIDETLILIWVGHSGDRWVLFRTERTGRWRSARTFGRRARWKRNETNARRLFFITRTPLTLDSDELPLLPGHRRGQRPPFL